MKNSKENHTKENINEMSCSSEDKYRILQTSMREDKNLKYLDLKTARSLKGARIQTIYYGYAHQDDVNDFIVDDVVTRSWAMENNPAPFIPTKLFKTRAENISYMKKHDSERMNTFTIINANNGFSLFGAVVNEHNQNPTFTGSDDYRYVQYRIVEWDFF